MFSVNIKVGVPLEGIPYTSAMMHIKPCLEVQDSATRIRIKDIPCIKEIHPRLGDSQIQSRAPVKTSNLTWNPKGSIMRKFKWK